MKLVELILADDKTKAKLLSDEYKNAINVSSREWYIGKVVKMENKVVLITGGKYLSNGLLSNYWNWIEVYENGSLSNTPEFGYG